MDSPRPKHVTPNLEFAYAIFAIAIAMRLGGGCLEIARSIPTTMIFTILTHCLNSAALNNYFSRADGRRFFLDTAIKGLEPLAPMAPSSGGMKEPNPRRADGGNPMSFYFPLRDNPNDSPRP